MLLKNKRGNIMKPFFLIFGILLTLFSAPISFAEESPEFKNISITINGVFNYNEYKTLLEDIKKVEGINDLIPSKEKSSSITVAGKIFKDSSVVKNDIEALVIDRYKFTSKDSKGLLTITLQKL